MPVPQLMTMAPNNGDQPCVIRSFTNGFRCVKTAQEKVDSITRKARMNGTSVLIKLMRAAETAPKRKSVTRSPRQAAMGGAMLSRCQSIYWTREDD